MWLAALMLMPAVIPYVYAQEEEWLLIDDFAYIDVLGFLHVTGELQNNYSDSSEFVRVTATVYDGSGTVVGTANGFTDISTIRPGERSSFDVVLSDKEQSLKAVSWKIAVSGDRTTSVRDAVLEVREGDSFIDVLGFYHVTGEISNGGSATANFVQVAGALYDGQDNIVGTVRGFTSPSEIPPGGTASFELIGTNLDSRNATRVSLNAESDEYANVVVPEFPLPLLGLVAGIASLIVISKRKSLTF